jgi:hypothetical protein
VCPDLKRYTDKYTDGEDAVLGGSLQNYIHVSLGNNPGAFPQELHNHVTKKRQRRDTSGADEPRFDENGVVIADKEGMVRHRAEEGSSDEDNGEEEVATGEPNDELEESDDDECHCSPLTRLATVCVLLAMVSLTGTCAVETLVI